MGYCVVNASDSGSDLGTASSPILWSSDLMSWVCFRDLRDNFWELCPVASNSKMRACGNGTSFASLLVLTPALQILFVPFVRILLFPRILVNKSWNWPPSHSTTQQLIHFSSGSHSICTSQCRILLDFHLSCSELAPILWEAVMRLRRAGWHLLRSWSGASVMYAVYAGHSWPPMRQDEFISRMLDVYFAYLAGLNIHIFVAV